MSRSRLATYNRSLRHAFARDAQRLKVDCRDTTKSRNFRLRYAAAVEFERQRDELLDAANSLNGAKR